MRFSSLALAATLASAALFGAEPTSSSAGYSVSVDFTTKGDSYTCRTEIVDLSNNVVISNPTVIGKKGEPATVKSVNGPKSLTMVFLVDKAATTGTYAITFSKDGKPVNAYKGSLSIR